MSMYSTVSLKNSIATQLLRAVFSLYILIAITVTIIHMVAEYHYTRANVLHELQGLQPTFEAGLGRALWEFNIPQLQLTVDGISKIPIIVGAKIEDTTGKEITAVGTIINREGKPIIINQRDEPVSFSSQMFSTLLTHKFPLKYTSEYGDTTYEGEGTFYSSTSVVWQEVKYGFVFIVLNSIIKTVALWVIFLWIARHLLSRPLAGLTTATQQIEMDNLENIKIHLKTSGRNELKILEEAFHSMIQRLIMSRNWMGSLRRVSGNPEIFKDRGHPYQFVFHELCQYLPMNQACLYFDYQDNQFTQSQFYPSNETFLKKEPTLEFIGHLFPKHSQHVAIFNNAQQIPIPQFYEGPIAPKMEGGHFIYIRSDSYHRNLICLYRTSEEVPFTSSEVDYVQTLITEVHAVQHNLEIVREKAKTEGELEQSLKAQQSIKEMNEALRTSHQQLEQQFAELQASYSKLGELDQTKEQFLKKMNVLNETHFPSLNEKLKNLLNDQTNGSKELTRQAIRDLHVIDATLMPFSSLYIEEQAIQSKRVLLAEANKKQQIIAKMALGGTGVELDIASSLVEGQRLLNAKAYDIICTDIEMISLSEQALGQYPDIQSVFMTSDDAPVYLPILQQHPFLSNIVSRNGEDRTFTLKNITTTVSKLVTKNYFGLEKYLNWGVEVYQHPVISSAMRGDLVEKMESYFKQLGVRRPLLSKCAMVVEELLMNAIYDAPVDPQGKALYNHLPRTIDVDLKREEQGLFRYACDGLLLAVSVEDPFGAFHRGTILQYLESCYEGRGGTLQQNKGGAGQGLFQIIEMSDLVVFNVKPKVRTEVIAIFNIDPNKPKSDQTTSFHYFYG